MISPKAYFAEVASKKRELDALFPTGYTFVISVANMDKNTSAGSIAEVSTQIAAKGIVDGTQRLMTADEIKAHQAAVIAQRAKIAGDERFNIRARLDHMFSQD